MTRLVLASASPARLSVLRGAGVDPAVRVSGVDEDAVAATLGPDAAPEVVVTALARAKADAVRADLLRDHGSAPGPWIVVGCDSMLHIGGRLEGKPHSVERARERWRMMAGHSGDLLTGHAVLAVGTDGTVREALGHSTTTVRFGTPTEADLDAYLATGEALEVAGAFTLDGLGGWFVDGIDGDPSSVIGIGLPLVRRLLDELGVSVADVWAANPVAPPS